MKIKKIELVNFRNYISQSIDFDDGLNVIMGKNAQGKTNLLEAIYFCAIGKSFRSTKDKEIIKWDAETSKIKLYIQKATGEKIIEIILSKKQKKTVKIDGIPINKIGELMGELNAVFFAPDELKLIKESPEDRRRFMDVAISQTNKEYFYLLNKYNKLLQYRNKTLKENIDNTEKIKMLSIYDRDLSDINIKIKNYRQDFIKNILPYAKMVHSYITDGEEEILLEYVGINQQSKQEVLEIMQKNYQKDISLGYTTYGVHRDDIKICTNNIDVRAFGSQGQQRTASLSLKLAQLEIMRQTTKAVPVLLLDDVLSELDAKRKSKLINFCQKAQTFITCTDFAYDVKHKKIEIEKGCLLQNNKN